MQTFDEYVYIRNGIDFRKPRPFPKLSTKPKLAAKSCLPLFIDYYINKVEVKGNDVIFRHSTVRTFRAIRAFPRARPFIFSRVTKCDARLSGQETFEIFMTMERFNGEKVNISLNPKPLDLLSFLEAPMDLEIPSYFSHVSKNKRFRYLDDHDVQVSFALHLVLQRAKKIQSISCGMKTFQLNHKVICESRNKKLTIYVEEMKNYPGLGQLGIYRRVEELNLFVDLDDVIHYENLFKRIFQSQKSLKRVKFEMDVLGAPSEVSKKIAALINFCRVIPYLTFECVTERKIDHKCFPGFSMAPAGKKSGAVTYTKGNTTIITSKVKKFGIPSQPAPYPVPFY
ncbi:unnamed protein product [Bursaphelenchus xylophilus]|uniref:(pine wood nematode) hypothetical protein n=1 Tax=Bursaphelenchus xylophilus TaxID=6326 RepID=A0A1I7RMT5_BURXY|nr:unnamed protein product [Bursaphelenchus xylophilus]CAG9125488.1 unnamed protein product [Bursaphelenchus xylophilus]